MGSDPVLRMKIRGVEGDMSLYRLARSIGGFSTNCFPRLTITNSVAAATTCKKYRKNRSDKHGIIYSVYLSGMLWGSAKKQV